MTSIFEGVLESVQAAGFEDFDSAVSTYYTYNFENDSAPDLAQKASRARRLRRVLTELHDSSATWTLWEARGYRDKIVQAAESVYDDEISGLAAQRGTGGRSTSALGSGDDSYASGETGATFPFVDHQGRQGALLSQTSPVNTQRLYQNKVSGDDLVRRSRWADRHHQLPNLWSLLTRLAGAQGPRCGWAALVAASVLDSTRHGYDVHLQELSSGLLRDSYTTHNQMGQEPTTTTSGHETHQGKRPRTDA